MKFLIFSLILLLISCKEECYRRDPVPNCACTLQFDPVCGCDGVTYGNECDANCAGVSKWEKGECKNLGF